MRRLAIAVGVAALASSWTTLGYSQDAKKVERGKQLFVEQKCKMCHSVGEEGNKKGPLDDVGSKLSAAQVKEWLVNPKEAAAKAKAERKPPMRSFASLPAEDVDALVAYLGTLRKK
jgi:cytochrome c2